MLSATKLNSHLHLTPRTWCKEIFNGSMCTNSHFPTQLKCIMITPLTNLCKAQSIIFHPSPTKIKWRQFWEQKKRIQGYLLTVYRIATADGKPWVSEKSKKFYLTEIYNLMGEWWEEDKWVAHQLTNHVLSMAKNNKERKITSMLTKQDFSWKDTKLSIITQLLRPTYSGSKPNRNRAHTPLLIPPNKVF